MLAWGTLTGLSASTSVTLQHRRRQGGDSLGNLIGPDIEEGLGNNSPGARFPDRKIIVYCTYWDSEPCWIAALIRLGCPPLFGPIEATDTPLWILKKFIMISHSYGVFNIYLICYVGSYCLAWKPEQDRMVHSVALAALGFLPNHELDSMGQVSWVSPPTTFHLPEKH